MSGLPWTTNELILYRDIKTQNPLDSLEGFRRKFRYDFLSRSATHKPSFVQIDLLFGEIDAKCLQASLQYLRESCRLLVDNKAWVDCLTQR